jgi:hypothetical protein
MKRSVLVAFAVLIGLIVGGGYVAWQRFAASLEGGELAQAREWSVLQGVELSHRGQRRDSRVLIVQNALGSDFDVIGIPRAHVEDGYLWTIANPSSKPLVKSLPQAADGVVSPEDLQIIKALPFVQDEVLRYVEGFADGTTGTGTKTR